jgi:hypothetical protein
VSGSPATGKRSAVGLQRFVWEVDISAAMHPDALAPVGSVQIRENHSTRNASVLCKVSSLGPQRDVSKVVLIDNSHDFQLQTIAGYVP